MDEQTTPARGKGWEVALADAVTAHQAQPFAYGVSDCMMLVADVARAMTGVDPMAEIRGSYDTLEGARAALQAKGWADVGAALAASWPEVAPAMARRGDAGLVEVSQGRKTVLAGVVVMGDMVMGKAPVPARARGQRPSGVVFWPRSALVKAYRIGW